MTSRYDRPRVKILSVVKFPADVVGTDGIVVASNGAVYTFSAPGIQAAENAADGVAGARGMGRILRAPRPPRGRPGAAPS